MTSQLPLAFNATYQATLQDFNWQQNTLLQQQLIQALDNQSERLFYLWGPSGSGKSHILQACCQYLSEFNQTSITHEQITAGGELKLVMGATPNKSWGVTADAE